MPEKTNIITLDGPSGVGKSTISRRIAAQLGYTYLDTGAMYRAVGFYLKTQSVDIDNFENVSACLGDITIRLLPARDEISDAGVILNGRDISDRIRTPEISMLASRVSTIPAVRMKLTEMQRQIGAEGRVVAEGRDTGTVVFPEAAHKFFLDADIRERAHRRIRQMRLTGAAVDEREVFEMIQKRDRDDSERSIAPLKKAEDALLIDTTGLTIEEVCSEILHNIES
ncbi:MAG: (d)CMP kinase [Desulfocapsaceae bacterium]|nr:(d)CMP kinase [Desulfocapsaceae bacterium]